MMEHSYLIALAGIPFRLNCRYPFGNFEAFNTEEAPLETITADMEALTAAQRYAVEKTETSREVLENIQLIGEVGSALLKYGRALFHGTAFIWHGKAWIFTAPSGTGKTTQYVLWKHRYGNELTILNGDKPILEFREDGAIWVHPSPWKGKENMGNMCSAPLGGIIYLKRGAENRVKRLTPSEVGVKLYCQFMFLIDAPDHVDRVCALETRLLESIPVWELTNNKEEASAELMHDTLTAWEER